jgi:hypothetical protein
MLMEQLDYNLLFRWFVGLNMDNAIGDATEFFREMKCRFSKWQDKAPQSGYALLINAIRALRTLPIA